MLMHEPVEIYAVFDEIYRIFKKKKKRPGQTRLNSFDPVSLILLLQRTGSMLLCIF